MTTYVGIGSGGADTWSTAVATVGDLPGSGAVGEVRIAQDTGNVYFWTGSMWSLIGAGAGAINIENIVSITDGSQAAAGELTEQIANSNTSPSVVNVGATGVFGYSISISVTAGRWRMNGTAGFDDNGATLTTALEAGISNSATGAGLTISDVTKDDTVSGSTVLRSFVVPEVFVSLNVTTTYYLNTKFIYSAGSPRHYGKISAVRVG